MKTYKVVDTITLPDKDEFNIWKTLNAYSNRLNNIFEYTITKPMFSAIYRIMDDEDVEDRGLFIPNNKGTETFSVFSIKGNYREPKEDCIVIDLTVLSDRGEDIVVFQFEVPFEKREKFIEQVEQYVKYYGYTSDDNVKVIED